MRGSAGEFEEAHEVGGGVAARLAEGEVGFEDDVAGGVQGAFGAGELRHDVHAVLVVLDHFLQAADLTFEAAQAVEDAGFFGLVVGDGHGGTHPKSIPPRGT